MRRHYAWFTLAALFGAALVLTGCDWPWGDAKKLVEPGGGSMGGTIAGDILKQFGLVTGISVAGVVGSLINGVASVANAKKAGAANDWITKHAWTSDELDELDAALVARRAARDAAPKG